ncbi:MAG: glycosyltransferase [Tumebacillaceae bacterium]
MRIYFYTWYAEGKGGLETVLELLSNELAARGHEVRVLTMGLTSRADRNWLKRLPNAIDCSRSRMGMEQRFPQENQVLGAIMDLQNVLSTLPEPDVIISTYSVNAGIARIATNHMAKRPKIVSWVHGPLNILGQPEMLHYADAHLAISSGIADQFRATMPDKPIATVFNPFRQDLDYQVPRSDIPTFLYVGRLDNRQKRVDVLLRALGRLRDKEFRLKIVGESILNKGYEETSLRQLAVQMGIDDRIEWYGWHENPWEAAGDATCFVMSSDFEGFPMVLGEALGRGLPVVASNCVTGPIDIVIPGENGWLFPPGDDEALANILGHIADGRLEMPSQQACVDSIRRFALETVVDNIEDALQHVVRHL